jgi:hypothetical protein
VAADAQVPRLRWRILTAETEQGAKGKMAKFRKVKRGYFDKHKMAKKN